MEMIKNSLSKYPCTKFPLKFDVIHVLVWQTLDLLCLILEGIHWDSYVYDCVFAEFESVWCVFTSYDL